MVSSVLLPLPGYSVPLMILDAFHSDVPTGWWERRAIGPLKMEGDHEWDDASPLDLRTKRNMEPSNRAEAGHWQRGAQKLISQVQDGKGIEESRPRVRSPESNYFRSLAGPCVLPRPHGDPFAPYSGIGMSAFNPSSSMGPQHDGVMDRKPSTAFSVGQGSALHPMGIPDEKPEIWRSQERSVCPVPTINGTLSPHCGDRPGFQSPKTVSPLGQPHDSLSPVQEPAVTHRAFGSSEMEGSQGPKGVEKSQNSLPLRKRRYAVQASEETLQPTDKVPKVEDGQKGNGTLGVKEEPRGEACAQPELPTNGCTHLGKYSSYPDEYTRPQAFYTGAHSSYLPRHLPVYPFNPHVMAQGTMLGIHATPYQLICPLESQLTSDIAIASKQDEDGDTALHIAVAHGNFPAIQRLICLFLQGQKDLDTFNNLRQTPLHLAVITKQPEVVRMLVKNQASAMALDRNGQTSIHLACEHSSIPCLQELLDQSQEAIDLETRNYEGFTPLHVAVSTSDPDIVSFLLNHGSDIDAVDIKSGRSPLIHAVENNSVEMVSLLIKNGANVNSQTYSGNTALHSASGRGLLDIVRILVKHGADSSIKNYHNDTSLMVASNKKVTDILRGKASRSLPHQGGTPKSTAERVKEMSPPGSSCNSSPSCQMSSTDCNGQLPITASPSCPVNPQLMPPASPCKTPRSTSSQSCESTPTQDSHMPTSQARHGPEEKFGGVGSLGLVCTQFTNGQSDIYPTVTYTSPYLRSMKVEGGLLAVSSRSSDTSLPGLGHPVRFTETPYLLLPLGNGVMDVKPPARYSPLTTSAVFPSSEHVTTRGLPLAPVPFSSPAIITHMPDSPISAINENSVGQAAAIRTLEVDMLKTKVHSAVVSCQSPTTLGLHRTKDNDQAAHSAQKVLR
ncbi:B-cell lymphoma 3 protein [Ambystoma mexicanum]|uniref:B-cell lymphoma 3 protein n=1 Tax=Ambystoma mexicanum TaxID=8296 RepID=UPI0037E783FE